jgi:hypothetical protein
MAKEMSQNNDMEFFKNTEQIFFGAIDLPDYAIPAYYNKNQIESGWDKDVFYHALLNVYEIYLQKLQFEKSRLTFETKSKEIHIDTVSIALPLEIHIKIPATINKERLEQLKDYIEIAATAYIRKPEYNSLQIIAFIERGIQFINNAFKQQIKPRGVLPNLKKAQIGTSKDIKPAYVLTKSYFFKKAGVLFDFLLFKNEVRSHLLYSPNANALKIILKPYYDKAKENVEIWNNELSIFERNEENGYKGIDIKKEVLQFSFEEDTLKVWNNNETFEKFTKHGGVQRYSNYEFAIFSAKIADLIIKEIFQNKEELSANETDSIIPLNNIKNNFDNNNIETVHEHFKQGLVDRKYLSAKDLTLYLKAAFDEMKVPGQLFILQDVQAKRKIIKVFADYYKTLSGKPHGKKRKYVALLTDYFSGYNTDSVSSNFSR